MRSTSHHSAMVLPSDNTTITEHEDCQSLSSTVSTNPLVLKEEITTVTSQRVRFAPDTMNEIYTYKQDARQSFYSKQELAAIRQDCREQTYAAEYLPDEETVQFCTTVRAIVQESLETHATENELKETTLCLSSLSSSSSVHPLLGLERQVCRALREQKRRALEEMLDFVFDIQQDVLFVEQEPALVANMIAAKCQELSRPLVRVAHSLARL